MGTLEICPSDAGPVASSSRLRSGSSSLPYLLRPYQVRRKAWAFSASSAGSGGFPGQPDHCWDRFQRPSGTAPRLPSSGLLHAASGRDGPWQRQPGSAYAHKERDTSGCPVADCRLPGKTHKQPHSRHVSRLFGLWCSRDFADSVAGKIADKINKTAMILTTLLIRSCLGLHTRLTPSILWGLFEGPACFGTRKMNYTEWQIIHRICLNPRTTLVTLLCVVIA